MNLKELEKLFKLCHKYSIKSIKLEGTEFTIEQIRQSKVDKSELNQTEEKSEVNYTDEDVLLWSSSGV